MDINWEDGRIHEISIVTGTECNYSFKHEAQGKDHDQREEKGYESVIALNPCENCTEWSVGSPPFKEHMRHASLPVQIHLQSTVGECGLDAAAIKYLHATAHLRAGLIRQNSPVPHCATVGYFPQFY